MMTTPTTNRIADTFTSDAKMRVRRAHYRLARHTAPSLFHEDTGCLRDGLCIADLAGAPQSIDAHLGMLLQHGIVPSSGGFLGVDMNAVHIAYGRRKYPRHAWEEGDIYRIMHRLCRNYNIAILHLDGYGFAHRYGAGDANTREREIEVHFSSMKTVAERSIERNGAFVLTHTSMLDGAYGHQVDPALSLQTLAHAAEIAFNFGGTQFDPDDLLQGADALVADRRWTGTKGAFDVYPIEGQRNRGLHQRMVVMRLVMH